MTNARGMVARSSEPVSASFPSMLRVLKFDGNDDSASRRLPPVRRVDRSWGLMSLVELICEAMSSQVIGVPSDHVALGLMV